MEALRRVKSNTVEKRLLNPAGNPNFGLNFYIINSKGEQQAVDVRIKIRCRTEAGPQTAATESLFEGKPEHR